jgi:hypothetical protein
MPDVPERIQQDISQAELDLTSVINDIGRLEDESVAAKFPASAVVYGRAGSFVDAARICLRAARETLDEIGA